MGDQAAGTFEDDDRCIFFTQGPGRSGAVSLNVGGADPKQPCSLPRMRSDDTALGQAHPLFGQQVQCIRIPDLWQRRVGGGR
ncbi:hypothetical protein D3C81_1534520 [compost metagenome]